MPAAFALSTQGERCDSDGLPPGRLCCDFLLLRFERLELGARWAQARCPACRRQPAARHATLFHRSDRGARLPQPGAGRVARPRRTAARYRAQQRARSRPHLQVRVVLAGDSAAGPVQLHRDPHPGGQIRQARGHAPLPVHGALSADARVVEAVAADHGPDRATLPRGADRAGRRTPRALHC